jgi:hypothetical protein
MNLFIINLDKIEYFNIQYNLLYFKFMIINLYNYFKIFFNKISFYIL